MIELLCARPQETVDIFLELDLIAWCQKYREHVRRDTLYEWDEPWLEQIYTDQAKEKVIMKAAQVRISEYLISESLWRMDKWNWNIFYANQTERKMQEFVKSRVNPAVAACPHMLAQRDVNDIKIKTFGDNSIFFSGAQREEQVTSASVDEVILDEYEFMPAEVRPVLLKRKGDSKWGFVRKAGHPRFLDLGMDEEYKKSDQKKWHSYCEYCRTFQSVTFDQLRFSDRTAALCDSEMAVPADAIHIHCSKKKCDEILPRGGPGKWIPENPDSRISGYWVNKLMRIRTDLAELVRNSRKTVEYERQAHHNYDMGEGYSPKGMQITRDMLDALIDKDYQMPSGAKFSVMGVDVGLKYHYWVERQKRVLAFGSVDEIDELDGFLPRYGVRTVVCDALPETHEVSKWAKKHKNRVALCYFKSPNEKKAEMISFDDKRAVVHVDRSMICDENERDITERRLVLPANANHHRELYKHFMSPKRIREQMPNKEVRVIWTSGGKADHLFFARNYALVARMLYREQGYGRGVSVTADNIGAVDGTQREMQEADW